MTSAMEPDLGTAAEPWPVLEELRRREPISLRPEIGRSRADLERMTAVDFREILFHQGTLVAPLREGA